MENVKIIAVLTPTYNRAILLVRLYESLTKQKSFNFVWYIIDDGSTDGTSEVVRRFDSSKFKIVFIHKNNGGKHTALNAGISCLTEPLTFIVDSDDYLTSDAIISIEKDWNQYASNDIICGMSYYRLKPDSSVIGSEYPHNRTIESYAEMRINTRIRGDKAEVWRTEILQLHPFPEYKGERFLSEAIVWNSISAAGYKLVYISKGIYICDYLEGGLTKAGRRLRLKTPYGTMHHARSFFYDSVKWKIRAKYLIYYVIVSIYAGKQKEAYMLCKGNYKLGYILVYIPSIPIAMLWKKKYR